MSRQELSWNAGGLPYNRSGKSGGADRPADEVVIAMMVRESITSPMRRASGFGGSAETVRTGLIATEVAEDRQKGT